VLSRLQGPDTKMEVGLRAIDDQVGLCSRAWPVQPLLARLLAAWGGGQRKVWARLREPVSSCTGCPEGARLALPRAPCCCTRCQQRLASCRRGLREARRPSWPPGMGRTRPAEPPSSNGPGGGLQVEQMATGAARAIGSLWGGLGGLAKDFAREFVAGVEEVGKDVSQLHAVKAAKGAAGGPVGPCGRREAGGGRLKARCRGAAGMAASAGPRPAHTACDMCTYAPAPGMVLPGQQAAPTPSLSPNTH
jgi:hypothetical protein